jgi:hypothetical protein
MTAKAPRNNFPTSENRTKQQTPPDNGGRTRIRNVSRLVHFYWNIAPNDVMAGRVRRMCLLRKGFQLNRFDINGKVA